MFQGQGLHLGFTFLGLKFTKKQNSLFLVLSTFSDIQTKLRHFDSPFLNRKYSVATDVFCLIWKSWQYQFLLMLSEVQLVRYKCNYKSKTCFFPLLSSLCNFSQAYKFSVQFSATRTNYLVFLRLLDSTEFSNIEFSCKTSFQPIWNKNIYMREVSKQ